MKSEIVVFSEFVLGKSGCTLRGTAGWNLDIFL